MRSYYDDYVKHAIYLEYYGNELSASAEELYAEFEENAEKAFLKRKFINTKSDVDKTSKETHKIIDEFIEALEPLVIASALSVAEKESSWLSKTAKKYLEKEIVVPSNIGSKVEYAPYDKSNTIDTFLLNTKQKLYSTYDNAAKAGYSFGTPTGELTANIKQNLKPIENNIKTSTQTMGGSFAKNTQRIIYGANESVFKEYRWNSMLDSSTCIVCGNLDGTIYENIEDAPFMPVHDHCRCFLQPLVEGQEYPSETYSTWLSKQSEAEQRKILGKTRYEMYKQGLPIKRFVNDGMTEKLTLDEIYSEEDLQ